MWGSTDLVGRAIACDFKHFDLQFMFCMRCFVVSSI